MRLIKRFFIKAKNGHDIVHLIVPPPRPIPGKTTVMPVIPLVAALHVLSDLSTKCYLIRTFHWLRIKRQKDYKSKKTGNM